MTPTNNLKAFPKLYANESDYVHKTFEDYLAAAEENYDKGFEPLQTLPASWYNSLLYLLTEQAQATKVLCDSIFAELQSVLTAGGIEPSASYTNQLLTAIETITKLNTATASILGGIKSSSNNWAIAVDPITSTASVNTVDASTSAKGIVQLNDSITSDSTTQAATANAVRKAVEAAKPGIATASTAGIIKSSSDNWGVSINPTTGTASVNAVLASTTNSGIVMLNDSISSSSPAQAATANAVRKAVEAAKPGIATASTAGIIKSSSDNWAIAVDPTTGIAAVNTVLASTTEYGLVRLSDSIDSPETDKAATANAVRKAVEAAKPGIATASKAGLIKSSSNNWCVNVNASSGIATVKASYASKSGRGIVQLNDNTDSYSTEQAATADAVRRAFQNGVFRARCSTAHDVAEKYVDAPLGFSARLSYPIIAVYFENYNSAANPTLKVGSMDAYPIKYNSFLAPAGGNYATWEAGEAVLFCYAEGYWRLI